MRIEVEAKIILTTEEAESEGLRAEDLVLAAEQKLNGLPLFYHPVEAANRLQTKYGIRVHMGSIEQIT